MSANLIRPLGGPEKKKLAEDDRTADPLSNLVARISTFAAPAFQTYYIRVVRPTPCSQRSSSSLIAVSAPRGLPRPVCLRMR